MPLWTYKLRSESRNGPLSFLQIEEWVMWWTSVILGPFDIQIEEWMIKACKVGPVSFLARLRYKLRSEQRRHSRLDQCHSWHLWHIQIEEWIMRWTSVILTNWGVNDVMDQCHSWPLWHINWGLNNEGMQGWLVSFCAQLRSKLGIEWLRQGEGGQYHQEWECSSFQQISSFCARNYQN